MQNNRKIYIYLQNWHNTKEYKKEETCVDKQNHYTICDGVNWCLYYFPMDWQDSDAWCENLYFALLNLPAETSLQAVCLKMHVHLYASDSATFC